MPSAGGFRHHRCGRKPMSDTVGHWLRQPWQTCALTQCLSLDQCADFLSCSRSVKAMMVVLVQWKLVLQPLELGDKVRGQLQRIDMRRRQPASSPSRSPGLRWRLDLQRHWPHSSVERPVVRTRRWCKRLRAQLVANSGAYDVTSKLEMKRREDKRDKRREEKRRDQDTEVKTRE